MIETQSASVSPEQRPTSHSLKHSDDNHHPDAHQHGQHLEEGTLQGGVPEQFRDDRDSGNVDKPPGGERENPGDGRRAHTLGQESAEGTTHGPDGRDQLESHGLPFRVARLDEDGKVADLVRDLVEEDGESGDDADATAGDVGGADCQSVGEVV